MVAARGGWGVLVALAVVVACDGEPDDPGGGDGGDTDAGTSAEVRAPEISWLDARAPTEILPCPSGWREVAEDDLSICEPWAADGPMACGRGEAQLPGEPSCRPLGDACPSGPFADSVPSSGPVVYVQAGAAPGGDGSLAAPLTSLSEVRFASLAAGTTVAIARGEYEGTLPLRAGVRVIGACAAETILTGIDAPVAAVVTVTSNGEPASVANLTIADAPQIGVEVTDGRALVLDGVVVERVVEYGIYAREPGTSIALTDVAVRETRSRADAMRGRGITAQDGARIDASRVVIERNRDVAALAVLPGAVVVLEDSVVRDTLAQESDGIYGRGLSAQGGGRIEASRVVIERNRDAGVYADGAGTEVVLADAVVRDTEGSFGRGVTVSMGARLSASRVLVERNRDTGVFVADPESEVVIADVLVRHTRSDDGLRFGRGVGVQSGARLSASRVTIEANREAGVFCGLEGATVTFVDTLVRRTEPRELDGRGGRGLSIELGGQLDATRLVLDANREVGLYAGDEGTAVLLTDAIVRATAPRMADQVYGRGAEAVFGAALEAERFAISSVREMGLAAGAGGSLTARDVSVEMVDVAACASTTCTSLAYGYGVAAIDGRARLTRFSVRDASACGIFVGALDAGYPPGSLDLESGSVSRSTIGACVQLDGYDLGRLTANVRYAENGTNLDTTTLPVPSPIGAVGD